MKKLTYLIFPIFAILMGCSNDFETETGTFSKAKMADLQDDPNTIVYNYSTTIDNLILGGVDNETDLWDHKTVIITDSGIPGDTTIITVKKGVAEDATIILEGNAVLYFDAGKNPDTGRTRTVSVEDYSKIYFNGGYNKVCVLSGALTFNGELYLEGCYLEDDFPGFNPDQPVDMIAFTSEISNETTATLKWATATEENSDKFVIERSTDNRIWTKVGEVKANGNTNHRIDYSFVDETLPSNNVVYYRLKQIDLDNQYALYGPNAIKKSNSSSDVTIYPNPVVFGEKMNILTNYDNMTVRLYDASGKTHFEGGSHTNFTSIPMIFGRGMMFVEVKSGKDKIVQKVIIK